MLDTDCPAASRRSGGGVPRAGGGRFWRGLHAASAMASVLGLRSGVRVAL